MIVWIVWLAASFGSFAVLEIVAIVRHQPTLSEQVWHWFRTREPGPWPMSRIVFAVALGAFVSWLWVHFTFAKLGG